MMKLFLGKEKTSQKKFRRYKNYLSGKIIKPYATNAGWLGKTFKEIEKICPNSKVEKGMNIVFESYSDVLVTPKKEVETWIEQL